MKPLPATVDRFEVRAALHDAGASVLCLGLDTTDGRPVVIQIVRIADPGARERFLASARALEPLRHPALATLVAAGTDGEVAYAAFAVAADGNTLESFLRTPRALDLDVDECLGIVRALSLGLEHAQTAGVKALNAAPGFIWITSSLSVQIAGLVPAADTGQPASPDAVYARSPSGDAADPGERDAVYTLAAVLVELLTHRAPQRTANGAIDLTALRAIRLSRPSWAAVPNNVAAQIDGVIERVLQSGSPRPLDLAGFRQELDAALAALIHPVPSKAQETPLVWDENVQFTVYRPRMLEPGKWHPLLAFAHLSERRPDAPKDEPDPTAEVARQAAALLGDMSAYRQSIEDSSQGVPRDGEITFVPAVPGVEFNPQTQSFLWTESVHRAEFRVRAQSAPPNQILHGRMSVYLGAILLAEINLSFGVGRVTSSQPDTVAESARPYRKIFASYSHRDEAVVRQYRDYAKAMGDEYLQDVINLRSGEEWAPALEALIRDADVFQLFWSWNSLQSEYVQNEWRYALGLRRKSFIRPVYWDDPLPKQGDLPPKDLLDLHFERIASWGTAGSGPTPRAMAPPTAPPPSMAPPSEDRLDASAGSRSPSVSDTARMSPTEALPELSQTRAAPSRSSGVKWRVLSAVAGLAIIALMVPTLYRTGAPENSDSATFPSTAAAPPAPAGGGSGFTSLSVVVATETGPVLNAGDAVQVQLIDMATNEVVAEAALKPDGTADFESIPPGEYTIDADVPGVDLAGQAVVTVPTNAPETTRQRLTLRPRALAPRLDQRERPNAPR